MLAYKAWRRQVYRLPGELFPAPIPAASVNNYMAWPWFQLQTYGLLVLVISPLTNFLYRHWSSDGMGQAGM